MKMVSVMRPIQALEFNGAVATVSQSKHKLLACQPFINVTGVAVPNKPLEDFD